MGGVSLSTGGSIMKIILALCLGLALTQYVIVPVVGSTAIAGVSEAVQKRNAQLEVLP